jgi:malonyl CoA-acyl carrier protein transacylase
MSTQSEAMVVLQRQCQEMSQAGAFLDWIEAQYEAAQTAGAADKCKRLETLYLAALTNRSIETDELDDQDKKIYEEWLALPDRQWAGRPMPITLVNIVTLARYQARSDLYEGWQVIGHSQEEFEAAFARAGLDFSLRIEGLID